MILSRISFPSKRERQGYVLNEIATVLASDYKYILLEAATGFGKNPVAIAVALTLSTSYICTTISTIRLLVTLQRYKETKL
jgi:ATP-dependent DNA helicase DinG